MRPWAARERWFRVDAASGPEFRTGKIVSRFRTVLLPSPLYTGESETMGSSANNEIETLLVMRAQCGDLVAFEQLLRRVHGPVRRYVVGLAGESEADDILQEVGLKVYRQIRCLREPRVFRAWVFRIATRIAFVHLRKAKRWRELESDPDLIRSMAIVESNGQGELDAEFLRLVDGVSPASRAVLLLHYQQHLSLDETAAILDIPVGTAKSRLSYGVAAVRRLIKGEKQHEH
jgi:RNA polymerase sigma-70 factor (ECF subfamily)